MHCLTERHAGARRRLRRKRQPVSRHRGRSGPVHRHLDSGSPTKLCAGPTGNATLLKTDQIIVHGNNAASNDAYVVDTLGPGKTPEADGNSELETVIGSSVRARCTVHGTGVLDIPCGWAEAAA